MVDPLDGREKVLVFGGRVGGSGSMRRQLDEASGVGDVGSTMNSPEYADSSQSIAAFAYSNKLWLFDPDIDEWTLLGPTPRPLTTGSADSSRRAGELWPGTRDRFAIAYHRGIDTVFVSGGRVVCTGEEGGGDDDACLQEASDEYLDLWGYRLRSRRWVKLDPGGGAAQWESRRVPEADLTESAVMGSADSHDSTSSSSGSTSARRKLLPEKKFPAARFLHSMSVLCDSDSALSPRDVEEGCKEEFSLVIFGGQLLRPWSMSLQTPYATSENHIYFLFY